MKCVFCKSNTKVTSTVTIEHRTIRSRICLSCRQVFYTEEIGRIDCENLRKEMQKIKAKRYRNGEHYSEK